jgi:poly(3-hydroxybutyrate) depolymerase
MWFLLPLFACGPSTVETPGDDTGEPSTSFCTNGTGGGTGGAEGSHDGMLYYVYVPSSLEACAPLVFFGHSGTNPGKIEGETWSDPSSTRFVQLADERGFAFVAPGANPKGAPHEWGFEEATTKMDAIAATLGEAHDLDRSRTWFAGLSAGGHVSSFYGLYDPGVITGVAVVAAGLGAYFDYPPDDPDPKVPFYVAHDPEDQVVDYSYSVSLAEALEAHGHTYTFVDWTLGQGDGHGWNPDLAEALVDWLEANPLEQAP